MIEFRHAKYWNNITREYFLGRQEDKHIDKLMTGSIKDTLNVPNFPKFVHDLKKPSQKIEIVTTEEKVPKNQKRDGSKSIWDSLTKVLFSNVN